MIRLYVPMLKDLWFREKLMGDPDTMSYNHAWGGTIPFPEKQWEPWYDDWITHNDNKRYYRYLINDNDDFVGEIAYHFDEEMKIYIADVIVFSKYRGKGYGKQGLSLLCSQAKSNGIHCLYDNIAIDNTAIKMFLDCGFVEEYRTNEIIVLKKDL